MIFWIASLSDDTTVSDDSAVSDDLAVLVDSADEHPDKSSKNSVMQNAVILFVMAFTLSE